MLNRACNFFPIPYACVLLLSYTLTDKVSAKTVSKKATSYIQAMDIHSQFDAQALVFLLRISNFEMDFFLVSFLRFQSRISFSDDNCSRQAYKECLRNKKESISKLTSATCVTISEMAQFFSQDFGSINKEKKSE